MAFDKSLTGTSEKYRGYLTTNAILADCLYDN